MTKVWFNILIVLSTSTSSVFCGNIFNVRTLPQLLTPARRLAPSDPELTLPTSSSSSSSSAFSSISSFSREEALSSEEDEVSEDDNSYPQYVFSYRVKDLSTGDEKQQEEKRDGDYVQGQYSLLDSDGSLRIVEYNSDDTNGFRAIVSRKPSNDYENNQQTDGKSDPFDLIATNIGPALKSTKSQQSSAKVSQNEQRLTQPEAIALARRFPALVLGHRVPTAIINHAPTLFSPDSKTTVVTHKGEEKAIQNAGRTIVESVQHPPTIIEHRPATTFITQLTPGRRTINRAHDIIN